MKLKSTQIAQVRSDAVVSQGHQCALCAAPIVDGDRVHLDHNHETGAIRAALHGTCNLLLGKVERGLKRGIRDPHGFVHGLAAYLDRHATDQTGLVHPLHLTPAEKKARAKKRVQKKRALTRKAAK